MTRKPTGKKTKLIVNTNQIHNISTRKQFKILTSIYKFVSRTKLIKYIHLIVIDLK